MSKPTDTVNSDMLDTIAGELGRIFKSRGFALLVFPTGTTAEGQLGYASNVDLAIMINALKEFILHVEPTIGDPAIRMH